MKNTWIRLRNYSMLVVWSLLFIALNTQGDNVLDIIKKGKDVFQPPQNQETIDPASDRLCDSLDRSYTLTENVGDLATNHLKCKFIHCNADEMLPKNNSDLDAWLRNYSKKHVWLPVPFETAMGASNLSEQQEKGLILERDLPNTKKLYAKVDEALAAAKKSYPQIPYELKVYVIDITDRVNAQATPGGYIFVTKSAAKDLNAQALQLVMGNEVAHLAKRHMSKQLQERLLETDQGVEMFKRLSAGGNVSLDAAFAKQIVDRLQCSFAKYDIDQESQADACSARVMTETGSDAINAWHEYVQARGTIATAKPKPEQVARDACFVSSATHPEDDTREAQLVAAVNHHRARVGK